ATPAGGGPDRAALVAAEGGIDLLCRHQRGAAARRAAGAVFRVVRIADRSGRTGVAAGREAQILARRLAGDGAAGVEHAGDDGGVDFGHIALERARAVHHRHAGHADVVLDRHRLAGKHALAAAGDVRLPVPGVVPVLLADRAIAGRARVLDRKL